VVQRDTRSDRDADSGAVSLRCHPRRVLRCRRQCDRLCSDMSTRCEPLFSVQVKGVFKILFTRQSSRSIHPPRVLPSRAITLHCTASQHKSSLCFPTFALSLPPVWYRTGRPSPSLRRVWLVHHRPGMDERSTPSSSARPGEAQSTLLGLHTLSSRLSPNRRGNCSALRG
jgi:hypothetical protein